MIANFSFFFLGMLMNMYEEHDEFDKEEEWRRWRKRKI